MAADRIRSLDDTHPGSSLLQPAATPLGGLTPADAPLIDAEILFRQPGPAQYLSFKLTHYIYGLALGIVQRLLNECVRLAFQFFHIEF